MLASLIGARIRHQVHFAPDPQSPAFPTRPQFVERRLVRDVEAFPKGVNYITFSDVGEFEVSLVHPQSFGGKKITVYTEPFNDSLMYVVHDEVAAERMRKRHQEIEVHPDLKGKTWVFGDRTQAQEQKMAA